MTTPFPFVAAQVLTAAQLNAITELVVNDKTASYTLVAGDAGERVIMNSASATTITVNTSIFTASQVVHITNKGAGVCTVTAGTATVSTTGTLALVQNASGVLYCISAGVFIFEAYGVASTSGVVQVKSTAKTDTFTTSSATFTDITGLSVSITPTSASNKILVIATYHDNYTSNENGFTRLMRDSTAIAVGDAAGTRPQCTAMTRGISDSDLQTNGVAFLDSPATTSATTYKVQAQCSSSAHTYFLNRTNNDSDGASRGRSASTITVMEVTP